MVIVDGANVVGSVPDGWWRDRYGAAERLRDALAERVAAGSVLSPAPGEPDDRGGGDARAAEEVVLVVEGAARRVEAVPGVRVEAAEGSGDDLIVALVAAEAAGRARPRTVVTADRALRDRVRALGAETLGPRSVRPGRSR
ncbi:NYN domain-containing protein [Streptomyces sp. ST2-7A]|uniref:NYN domain-containing protein n=1 Tax=Streptomyces sp. ST2-7A TaxID=2907214 RepID=UPI001F330DBE|nr:NYN domain-containing protein [Streptomyces sp. ST2-7A]MCE7083496.1 NYN domain-containing protein [Streptomyces sp. ST2-7A]